MDNTNLDLNVLKAKADEYKNKLSILEKDKQDVDRQLIILEEQHKQYQEKIQQAFGTIEPQELQKIAAQYMQDIETLESQL